MSRIGRPSVGQLHPNETMTLTKVAGDSLKQCGFSIAGSRGLQEDDPSRIHQILIEIGGQKIASRSVDGLNKSLGFPSEDLETAAERVGRAHLHGSGSFAPKGSDSDSSQTSFNAVNKTGLYCEEPVSKSPTGSN